MSAPILEAKDLGRWYGEVVGLSDLQVQCGPGITGLLGPNGAGKSTFMRLVVGELRPSRGSLKVLGMDPFANRELYHRLGFAPQQDALYEDMTGRQFVRHLLRLGGFSAGDATKRAGVAMERVGLAETMDRQCKGYSKGMRQRTRLAQAIAHEPELLILDEPLTGLDPVGRRQTLELFRELASEGKSLIVSSHILHEVQSMTEQVVLLHRGRLLAQGNVAEIRKLLSSHPREVRLQAKSARRLAVALMEIEHVQRVEITGEDSLTVRTHKLDSFFSDLGEAVRQHQPGLLAMSSSDADLESVFDFLVQ